MKTNAKILVTLSLFLTNLVFVNAQNNPFQFFNESDSNSIVMTWNKNTPESEMQDDIKALKQNGVSIKYSKLKRNSKGEITSIKVEYDDEKGNKGKLEMTNTLPISEISFFKSDNQLGFGKPQNQGDLLANNDFFNNFPNRKSIIKEYNFNGKKGNSTDENLEFNMPEGGVFSQKKSKIIIQKDGKKPLVIEDGEVIEGADDYSKEEIEEIKKKNKVEFYDDTQKFEMNPNGFGNLKEQMQEMQEQLKKLMPELKLDENKSIEKLKEDKSDIESTKDEMLKAKDEMLKAKKELEEAKKEIEKTKSSLKIKKV